MDYRVWSKLEERFMNARIHDKEFGYRVDYKKSGVFLKSAGDYADPIYNKGEVTGGKDEYIITFALVKDRQNSGLEVGKDLKVLLSK